MFYGGPETFAGNEIGLAMLEAWTLYQDSLCSGCGQPAALVYDLSTLGEIEVKVITCVGCRTKAKGEERAKEPWEHVTLRNRLLED